MDKKNIPYFWVVGVLLLVILLAIVPFIGNFFLDFSLSRSQIAIDEKLSKESEHFDRLSFQLKDPEQAPSGIHAIVMRGYDLMTKTYEKLPKYVGNEMSCTNCHFAGGNTTGGKNGGISLAGIAAVYPQYNERSDEVITLEERINGCFLRSMNGLPLPLNGEEMDAFVTYLHWISKDFPIYADVPWRGLDPLKKGDYKPDPIKGGEKFEAVCAPCHGKEGEGAGRIPALWGPKAFNDGAGMNKLDTFASFIYSNMPYQEPELTVEEAYDIASYVTKQPRPKYHPKN